jgi:ABC-type Zn uptake system ZnuABC Zn-binding protein ZnuA
MKLRLLVLLILLTVFVSGGAAAQDAPIRVLATTTILADVAQNVAGDLFTVDTLVPADADTHAFEPSTADVARVAEADLLLVVGAGYEAFLGDLLENAGSEAAQVITVSNGVEILGFSGEHEHEGEAHIGVLGVDAECDVHEHEGEEAEHSEEGHEHGECDAHVWTDPMNGVIWANNIADAFSTADAANAAAYRANADAYIAQLEAVDAEIERLVAGIPEERRILVTNHEFMGYFAHAYGFEVVGTVLPGATTDAEPNPQELADLIALVQEEGVPAIFAEVSANPQLAEVVAEEAGIAVVTTLYSESLSGSDGRASTYLEYLRYNAQTIAQALGS